MNISAQLILSLAGSVAGAVNGMLGGGGGMVLVPLLTHCRTLEQRDVPFALCFRSVLSPCCRPGNRVLFPGISQSPVWWAVQSAAYLPGSGVSMFQLYGYIGCWGS